MLSYRRSMRIVTAAITSAVLVVVVAGCSAAAPEPTASTPSPVVNTPTAEPDAAEADFVDVDPALFFVSGQSDVWGEWATDDVNFVSPDGNIACGILGAEKDFRWGCKIRTKTWEFSSNSPDDFCFESQVSCGQGIEVEGTALPHPWRRSDPGFPATFALDELTDAIQVLNTGEAVTFGDVTCFSEESVVRCENAVSGHGFVISESRNEIF